MSWLTRYYDFPTVVRGDRPPLQIALYQDTGMTALVNLAGTTTQLIVSANPGGAVLKTQPLQVNGAGRLVGIDWAELETIGAGQLNLFYQLKVTFPMGNVRSPLNGRIKIAHATTDARESRIGDRVRVISDIEIAVIEIGVQGPPGPGGGPGGTVAWGDITDKPTAFPPSGHVHSWSSVTDKPTTFPPATHQHVGADVTDIAAVVRALVAALLAPGANITITPSSGGTVLTIAASGGGGAGPWVGRVNGYTYDFSPLLPGGYAQVLRFARDAGGGVPEDMGGWSYAANRVVMDCNSGMLLRGRGEGEYSLTTFGAITPEGGHFSTSAMLYDVNDAGPFSDPRAGIKVHSAGSGNHLLGLNWREGGVMKELKIESQVPGALNVIGSGGELGTITINPR